MAGGSKRFSRQKKLKVPVEITTEKAAQRITILEKKNCDKGVSKEETGRFERIEKRSKSD